jgi:acetylornithine deacetylase/succinyl-diaminopimelate desuccinylase-like protein
MISLAKRIVAGKEAVRKGGGLGINVPGTFIFPIFFRFSPKVSLNAVETTQYGAAYARIMAVCPARWVLI